MDRLAQRVSGLLYNDALPIAALWSAKRSEFTGPRAERYYALAALLLAYLAEETARSKSTLAVRLAGLSDALHRRKIDGKAFRAFVLRHYAARDKQLDLLRQPPCSWQSSILSNWHLGAKSWSGVNGTTIERPLLPRRRFELRLAGRLRSGHLLIRLGSSYDRDPSDLWRLRIERTAFHLGRADRRAAKTRRWTRPDTPEFELRLRFDERQVQLVVGGAVRVTFARRHNFVSLLRVENRGEVEIRRLLLVE